MVDVIIFPTEIDIEILPPGTPEIIIQIEQQAQIQFVSGTCPSLGPVVMPAYAFRSDDASSIVSYYGEAAINTLNSDAFWRIKKVTFVGGVLTVLWAASGAFSQIWDNRVGLTYE